MKALMALLAMTVGCAEPAVSACEAQCEKRASCGTDIDVAQCRSACADSALTGSDDCQAAQLEHQECQVALPCDAYLADSGCDDERAEVEASCAAP